LHSLYHSRATLSISSSTIDSTPSFWKILVDYFGK
jgi:hypothetical protein